MFSAKNAIPCAILLFASLLGAELLLLLNSGGDRIGYDFVYFIPRLISTALYWKQEGLSLPLYTPMLCGGLPLYADPQSPMVSLPQVLTPLLGVWTAIELSSLAYIFLGMLSVYWLATSVFRFRPEVSFAAACFFCSNGFFVSRTLSGAVPYQQIALLPLLFWLQFRKAGSSAANALLLGGLLTFVLLGGGYFIILIFLLDWLLIAALLQLRDPLSGREWMSYLGRGVLAGGTCLVLCAGKLEAIFSYLSHFPRPAKFDGSKSLLDAAHLIFSQLFGYGFYNPPAWAHWEYNATLSPLVLFGVGYLLARHSRSYRPKLASQAFALIVLFSMLLFIAMLSTGFGPAEKLHALPLLGSFRISMRFSSAFILPLVFISCVGWELLWEGRKPKDLLWLAGLAGLAAPIPLFALVNDYAIIPFSELKSFRAPFFNMSGEFQMESISKPESSFSDSKSGHAAMCLARDKGDCPDLDPDFAWMLSYYSPAEEQKDIVESVLGRSPALCTTAYFERRALRVYPAQLEAGPIRAVREGRFNMANPACYVYPVENSCLPGDRIAVEDAANLEALVAFRKTAWAVSERQQLFSKISFGAWILYGPVLFFLILLRPSSKPSTCEGGSIVQS